MVVKSAERAGGSIEYSGSGFDRKQVGIGHPASSRLARDQQYIAAGRMPPRFTELHGLVMDSGREQQLVQELQRIATQEGATELQRLLACEDEGGCTVLMRAAYQGSVANVRALLAVGADASATSTRTRRTAMHEVACSVHDNPYISGLILGAGCDPEQKGLVNGRTCMDITKLKIGPDGRLGTSRIHAQLLPMVRENSFKKMGKGHIRGYEGEVLALRHIAEVVGISRCMAKHVELMAAVQEFGLDLLDLIEGEGVERAVEMAMSYGQQLTRSRMMETAPANGNKPKRRRSHLHRPTRCL